MKSLFCNKTLQALFTLSILSQITFAQELNIKVTVVSDQIRTNQQMGETQVFNQLQNSISEFLNTRKWTNDNFAPEEKIQGNLTITLLQASANGGYQGNATLQANRPIYNTTYDSPLFRFVDRSIGFSYLPTTPLNYNDNGYSDNLTSLLAFYAYIILAFDYDSFGKMGGNPYVQKAYNVSNLAQNVSGDAGWDNRDLRNRFALIENLQNQQLQPFREGLYNYHRLGLDNFQNAPDETRRLALKLLEDLKVVNQLKPTSVALNSFFDSKSDEITNIFVEASQSDKQRAYDLLVALDPTKTESYKRLMR